MKPIVALPFHSQARAFCQEARQMLLDAGFQLRCNDSGKRPTPEDLKEMLSGAYAVVAGTEKFLIYIYLISFIILSVSRKKEIARR